MAVPFVVRFGKRATKRKKKASRKPVYGRGRRSARATRTSETVSPRDRQKAIRRALFEEVNSGVAGELVHSIATGRALGQAIAEGNILRVIEILALRLAPGKAARAGRWRGVRRGRYRTSDIRGALPWRRVQRIADACARRELRRIYQRELRRAAPKRTGRLRRSIRATVRGGRGWFTLHETMVYYGRIHNERIFSSHFSWADQVKRSVVARSRTVYLVCWQKAVIAETRVIPPLERNPDERRPA